VSGIGGELIAGGLITIVIAAGAWLVAATLGLLIALARNARIPVVASLLTAVIFLLRSVPQLVVIYLLYFGLGRVGLNLGSIPAAIIALGVTDAAFTAEAYRASLRTVSEQQREAGLSLGLSRLQVMRRVVLPQTIPFMIPPLLNTFVGLLKTATIASAVGAPEMLYRAQGIIQRSGIIVETALLVIAIYVAVTWPLSHLVGTLENRVRTRSRAQTA
jgi:glutamate transport system permease protein